MKTLDTRDLQERLEELEALRDSLETARDLSEELAKDTEATQESIDEADAAERKAEMDYGDDEAEELAEIESLKDEVGGEWKHGVQLIPESDFEDYARELAEDIGAIKRDMEWPCNHIDWAAAADSLKMDYTSTTFMGTDYLYRA
jgi:predicted  nucleic acid-binding Zn-ribbon protein